MPPPPFRIQPNDPKYHSDAAGEAVFFDKPQYFGTKLAVALPQQSPLEMYNNHRLTGDATRRWIDVIPEFGDFRRGLFFGVSDVDVEDHILHTNPNLHLTFMDISKQSLESRDQVLGTRFPGRVRTEVADLNFAELQPDTFDVVISFSVLHHLQNIEWVAHQINRSLTADGRFFLNDYVAENRFQFSDRRRSIMAALLARAKRNGDVPPSWDIPWPKPEPWKYSPFEAIRCEDTLETLAQTLDPVQVRGTGALTPLLVIVTMSPDDERKYVSLQEFVWHHRPYSPLRRMATLIGIRKPPALSKRFLDDLTLMDSLCIDSGLLSPLVAFGVYRKRT